MFVLKKIVLFKRSIDIIIYNIQTQIYLFFQYNSKIDLKCYIHDIYNYDDKD
jgi:hypothetical protein